MSDLAQMVPSDTWPKVSVVFVTYKRLATLEPTLATFLSMTDYPRDRLELIVADDGSPRDVQAAIRTMPFDVFCLSPHNRGLGANFNQGLAAATGELILQLQDDWDCVGPSDYLRRAVAVLQSFADIGMVICRPHPRSAELGDTRLVGEDQVRLLRSPVPQQTHLVGDLGYSDWPHVKRRSFVDLVGPYQEGPRMWETELDYARRVASQRVFIVSDIVGLDAFRHSGAELSFNRGPWSGRLAAAIERLPLARPAVNVARRIKRRLSAQRSRTVS